MGRTKLGAGLVAYNAEADIGRCLKTLWDFDVVIVCEGAYDLRCARGEPRHSTDRTLEIVESFPNTVVVDVSNMKQTDARNAYMIKAAELGCDWVLTVESDEIITQTRSQQFKKFNDLSYFRSQLPTHDRHKRPRDLCYSIMWHDSASGTWFPWARLYYKPQYVRFGNMHYSTIVNGIEKILDLKNNTIRVIPGLYIHHDESLRSKEHQKAVDSYAKELIAQETEARERLFAEGKIL